MHTSRLRPGASGDNFKNNVDKVAVSYLLKSPVPQQLDIITTSLQAPKLDTQPSLSTGRTRKSCALKRSLQTHVHTPPMTSGSRLLSYALRYRSSSHVQVKGPAADIQQARCVYLTEGGELSVSSRKRKSLMDRQKEEKPMKESLLSGTALRACLRGLKFSSRKRTHSRRTRNG